MPKFRSKPTVIDAEQFIWKDGEGIPDIRGVKYEQTKPVVVHGGVKLSPVIETAYVETPNGKVGVIRGDWIVREPDGSNRYYPIKPNVFDAKYEPVEPET